MDTNDISNASTSHDVPARLLGVWAHPDDEAYLASGLMRRVIAHGGTVTVVAITDGELGFGPDDQRSAAERSAQRRAEMRDAMGVIGVRDIRFLGLPDGGVADQPAGRLSRRIAAVIREIAPDVITTFGPDGVTGHQDHIAAGAATTSAWLGTGTGDLWYAAKTNEWLTRWRREHDELGIWMTQEPTGYEADELTTVVDLDGGELGLKRRVLSGHASQTAAVAAAFGESAYLEWVDQESFRRPTAAELVDVAPTSGLTDRERPARRPALSDTVSGAFRVAVAPDGCTKFLEPV